MAIQIKIKINDEELEIDLNSARELFEDLKEVFEPETDKVDASDGDVDNVDYLEEIKRAIENAQENPLEFPAPSPQLVPYPYYPPYPRPQYDDFPHFPTPTPILCNILARRTM